MPRLAPALVVLLLSAACGGGTSEPTRTPTQPDVASIPTAPAPQPTPTPTPGTEPEPVPGVPGGGGDGGVAGRCGAPTPPPVSRMALKVHGSSGDRSLLDSTPLVGPDAEYCKKIGFTDGRTICPVRMEGSPEREACEAARVGRASDTGRPGPTWSANGKRCNGPDGGTACLNHSENQYLVWAYGAGSFKACTASGVCGELVLP